MLGFSDQYLGDGSSLSRRAAMAVGGAAGVSLWNGPATNSPLFADDFTPPATAKSIIFLALYGGPPHQETYDLRPDAPVDMRGEFTSIPTSLPGFRICEYMPKLAKLAHLYTIIRSVTHKDNGHESAFYALMTGRPHPLPNTTPAPAPTDFPTYGATLNYLKGSSEPVPGYVMAGGVISTGIGQNGGFLGTSWAPYLIPRDANEPDFSVPELTLLDEVPQPRLSRRHSLLDQLDALTSIARKQDRGGFSSHQQRAFDMLAAPQTRAAFDMGAESPATRDAYGNHPFGQNLLLARRLSEAGVPIVQVNWRNRGDGGLDTHQNNFNLCKGSLLPKLDGCISALLNDLEERGKLDETLVIAAGEFGRTPKINRNAGRDHWAGCNSILMAGGGIKQGYIHGSSNRTGAYPATNPVGPWDIYATMLRCYGIDPATEISDADNRPHRICQGTAIEDVLMNGTS